MSEHKPMTPDQIFENDAIMECNAHIGAPMAELVRLVRVVETAVSAPLLERIAALEAENTVLAAESAALTNWHCESEGCAAGDGYKKRAAEWVQEFHAIKAELEGVKKDAQRWKMLPSFLNTHQISYRFLLSDIDAAIDAIRNQGGDKA